MKNNRTNTAQDNEIKFIHILKATDKELIRMYIRGDNKYALKEMRARGLY
jgi:multisubunit Na+/H+ antiporter MnhE subunit